MKNFKNSKSVRLEFGRSLTSFYKPNADSLKVSQHFSKKRCSFPGCQFYPLGEYLRFVRVPESLPVGGEVIQLDVYPRKNLILQPVDKVMSNSVGNYVKEMFH